MFQSLDRALTLVGVDQEGPEDDRLFILTTTASFFFLPKGQRASCAAWAGCALCSGLLQCYIFTPCQLLGHLRLHRTFCGLPIPPCYHGTVFSVSL